VAAPARSGKPTLADYIALHDAFRAKLRS